MSVLFSIICNVISNATASFTQAIEDADTMADASIAFAIMSTDQKVIDFWSKFYRIMYRVFAIVNLILFGMMLIKAIFGVNVLFWMQWSFENLCTRIYEHVKVQMTRPLIRQKKLETGAISEFDDFIDVPDEDWRQARIDMVNSELNNMAHEIVYDLRSEVENSDEEEIHICLKNRTLVTIRKNQSGGVDFNIDWSDKAFNEAVKRIKTAIM